MNSTAGRGKWAKPWLTGFWVVILLTTLTVPAWAESFTDLHIERGEVDVLNDVDFKTSVAFGEPLLTSPEFPKGRLQPYFTAEDSTNFFPPDESYTDTSVRVKVGAGVAWSPLRNIAIFGEYRPEFELRERAEPVTQETDVNTHHHIVGGISFRF